MIPDYGILLTPDDCGLMIRHNLTFEDILDARGLKQSDYNSFAKIKGLEFVFVGRSCMRGHWLKLRNGNCPVCNPSSIGFSKRHSNDGFIYIAYSKAGRLVKIGAAECYTTRLKTLNKHRYAGFGDWTIKSHAWSKNAYLLEEKIQRDLQHAKALSQVYFRGNSMLTAREVYRISLKKALEVFHHNCAFE